MAVNVAHADIYKYVDKEGVLHLTNMPTDHNAKYVMILREKRILFQPNLDVNKYDSLITKAADKFKLDSALIKAVIKAESNFNHRAVSPVGAQGLMQLMPKTASSLNVEDSFHPEKNIEGGARYLRYLLNTYRGNLDLALAAYNAGEKAVAKYNYNIPPYRETQNYVRRVMSFYKSYSNQ
jgi:soluble lytic murein transglycosylase-like protein